MNNETILKKKLSERIKKNIYEGIRIVRKPFHKEHNICTCSICEMENDEDRLLPYAMTVGICIILSIILMIACCRPAHAADIVSIARSQLGQGETIADNKGKSVYKYTNGKAVPWCAAFVSWTLKQSGKDLPYALAAKSFIKIGKRIDNPRSGDLLVLSRNGGGHVGIIESINGNTITTIEGNKGKFPAKVKRVNYSRNNIKNFIAFVRI